jgi:hypothetical protein
MIDTIKNAEFFAKDPVELASGELRFNLPSDLVSEVDALRDSQKQAGFDALEKMASVFSQMQDELRQMAPKLDMGPLLDKMHKRLDATTKRRDAAMAALASGTSELGRIKQIMGLQSRVISGENLHSILSASRDPSELLALSELSDQIGDTDIQAQAMSKAVSIATGGADSEIERLQVAIRAAQLERTRYSERWAHLIDCLGWAPRHG